MTLKQQFGDVAMKSRMWIVSLASLLLYCGPVWADAPVCATAGGEPVPLFEPLNKMTLEAKFDDLSAALSAQFGGLAPDALDGIKKVFPTAFASCSTLAVREDPDGLVQAIVLFEGTGHLLFAYWVGGPRASGLSALSFDFNTDFSKILERLR